MSFKPSLLLVGEGVMLNSESFSLFLPSSPLFPVHAFLSLVLLCSYWNYQEKCQYFFCVFCRFFVC
jgi:hypothetical protein